MRFIFLISLFCTLLNANPLVLDGFAIRYNQGDLSILNQQKLPLEEEWIDVQTPEQMVEIITSLKVRFVSFTISRTGRITRKYPKSG